MKYQFLILSIFLLYSCQNENKTEEMNKEETTTPTKFDWQGHRGARGLVPENSIPSFLKAMEFPVTTLELDVAISKDSQVIVSHEPWMSHSICTKPDGTEVTKEEAMSLRIYEMTYEEIKGFDSGSRGNVRFPDQQPMAVHKPSLADVVGAVKNYCKERNLEMPNWNIEIKSHPRIDSLFTPKPAEFANVILESLQRLGIYDKTNLQSFDIRPLQYIRKIAPEMRLAFLVENSDGIDANMKKLGFTPEIYSPEHILLSKESVDSLHNLGMKVIPWTVNTVESMKLLKEFGVDGIITDYPNLIEKL